VLAVAPGVELGCRVHLGGAPRGPVLLWWHGNAEVIDDVDGLLAAFLPHFSAVAAVEYRGYGFSTGTPQLSKLTNDAERAAAELQPVLVRAGLASLPLVAYGRSLGAVCAVHLAARQVRPPPPSPLNARPAGDENRHSSLDARPARASRLPIRPVSEPASC